MNILEGIPATKADIVSILDSDIKTRTEFAQTFYNNFSRCVGLPVLTLTASCSTDVFMVVVLAVPVCYVFPICFIWSTIIQTVCRSL